MKLLILLPLALMLCGCGSAPKKIEGEYTRCRLGAGGNIPVAGIDVWVGFEYKKAGGAMEIDGDKEKED